MALGILSAVSDRAQQSTPSSGSSNSSLLRLRETRRKIRAEITQTVSLVDVLFHGPEPAAIKLVADLEKDDFKIWDDKNPQSIRYFSSKPIWPLAHRPADGYFPTVSETG